MEVAREFFVERLVDQPRASLGREIREKPLGEDDQPIAEADEIYDVDEAPGKPGDEAAELDFSEHADRLRLSDRRHRPFI